MSTLMVALLWTLSLVGLFVAAVSDFRHRIIPNRLVMLTAGCGATIRLVIDPRSIGLSIAIAAVLVLALGLAAHRQWIGGGDAKLVAAVTLLVPPGEITALLLIIAVSGGLLSGIYLVAHATARRRAFVAVAGGRSPLALSRREGMRRAEIIQIAESRSIPYGVAIFTGAAFVALTEAGRWFYAIS